MTSPGICRTDRRGEVMMLVHWYSIKRKGAALTVSEPLPNKSSMVDGYNGKCPLPVE
jgi:hypothetical protein